MTNDLAHKIAAACLEAIQARPDTPTEEELADVVRPLLPEPVTYHGEQVEQLTVEQIEKLRDAGFPFPGSPADREANEGWPLNNDVESTRGKWLSGDFIPQGPKVPSGDPGPAGVSTQELHDAPRVNRFKSGPCPADGCNGVVIRNSINNAGGCTCCGRGFAPTPTPEAGDDGDKATMEWELTYGPTKQVRNLHLQAAAVVGSFDYLLSGNINTEEAIRRLRQMRDVRRKAYAAKEPADA